MMLKLHSVVLNSVSYDFHPLSVSRTTENEDKKKAEDVKTATFGQLVLSNCTFCLCLYVVWLKLYSI